MKYRTLGRTGIEVSEIGLGTWAFGNNVYGGVAEKEGIRTIHEAIDLGVTLFDTAPQYGTKEQDGVAEIVLGKALKGKRQNVVIQSKFGRNFTIEDGAPQFYKSRIIASVEESLRRLQTDYLDVLFFHSPFSEDEIHDDVWEGVEQVIKSGKVRFMGHSISMFKATEHMARDWAEAGKIDVIQVVVSLMYRESLPLLEALSKYPIGIVARECLANGFLAGVFDHNTTFAPGTLNARYSREEIIERVDQVKAFEFLKDKQQLSMVQAALRWVLDQTGVSTVLSGAKNSKELAEAIGASDAAPFDEEMLRKAAECIDKDYEPA